MRGQLVMVREANGLEVLFLDTDEEIEAVRDSWRRQMNHQKGDYFFVDYLLDRGLARRPTSEEIPRLDGAD